MNRLTIRDLDVRGKRVFVRVDFNCPIGDDGQVTDDTRIVAALPTLRYLSEKGARLVLASHLGRPKGVPQSRYSLSPVVARLTHLLKLLVGFVDDCVGAGVLAATTGLPDGGFLMLENLRFHAGEEANDPEFARALAQSADLYVNDAFGTAHRAHASTVGITQFLSPSAAGFLMEKELKYLGQAIGQPKRPFWTILGGAKISGKIDVIGHLFDRVEGFLIGGGMAFTFLKAGGHAIGSSLVEADKLGLAADLLKRAGEKNVPIVLPVDLVEARGPKGRDEHRTVDGVEIADGWMGVDIGPRTVEEFRRRLARAGTILWNGPMGIFEEPPYDAGTLAVARLLADATKAGTITIVGGGDSAAAIAAAGLDEAVTHVSTGGGASLEFLEGRELPGVAALTVRP
ncbi:MAG: phosphoglycerate kinase [Candidatus Eisenbacteria bacterium]|nr:phosphoglycerate kinase [Candidatus Eisenbacteria bacterium]